MNTKDIIEAAMDAAQMINPSDIRETDSETLALLRFWFQPIAELADYTLKERAKKEQAA